MIAKIDSTVTPREYCVQVVYAVLDATPEQDAETLRALPNSVLRRLARAFAASRHGLDKPLPPNRPVFDSFKTAVRSYLDEQTQRMRELWEDIGASLKTVMMPLTEPLVPALLPAVRADLTRSVNRDFVSLVQGLALPPLGLPEFKPLVPLETFSSLSQSIAGMADTITRLTTAPIAEFGRQLAVLQQGTYWAQQSQSYLADIARLASSSSIALHFGPLFTAASDMSFMFSTYFDDVREAVANNPLEQRTLATDLVVPARTSAIALGTVKIIGGRAAGGSVGSAPAAPASPSQLRSNIDTYLARVQPRFVAQWHGAWEALVSNNPDRLRQAAHSARELLSQILHELAPDSTFSSDELRQCNGRPTRKMRVAKIFHTTTGSSNVTLIEAQARLMDEMYQSLSGAAHKHGTINEEVVAGYLMSLDGVLLILLSGAVRNS